MFRFGLQAKINLIVAAILLCLFGLFSWVSYRQHRDFIIAEAVDKARIIASETIRAREYVSDQLKRGEVGLSAERYGLIPVVASNRIGELVAKDLGYSIRQVSSRFRNPKNAPDEFEALMLQNFLSRPQLKEDFVLTQMGEAAVFRYMQPFRVEESCLLCHGNPEDAPEFIRDLFPDSRDKSYHYQMGQVIGAASVTIPVDNLQEQILANFRRDLLFSGGIFLALILALGLLTRVTVLLPLGRLGSAIAEIVRTGRFEEKIPSRRGRDEIETLIGGFNEMIDTLGVKSRELKESEHRYRVLTETARDSIISFLGNGQIILFNRESERMFGYSKREVLGVSVRELIHEDCEALKDSDVETYLSREATRIMREIFQVQGKRRDGRRLELEVSLSVADSEGHLFYTAILREKA